LHSYINSSSSTYGKQHTHFVAHFLNHNTTRSRQTKILDTTGWFTHWNTT